MSIPFNTGNLTTQLMNVPGFEQIPTTSVVSPNVFLPPNTRTMQLVLEESPAVILILDLTTGSAVFSSNKFILQSISRPKTEKFQIQETFGNSKLFFFGDRTKIYTIQGQLLEAVNTTDPPLTQPGTTDANGGTAVMQDYMQFKWLSAFQTFYDTQLRGSLLAENNQIAMLYAEGVLMKGYPIQLTTVRDGAQEFLAQFQMTWIIVEERIVNSVYLENLYDKSQIGSANTAIKTRVKAIQSEIAAAQAELDWKVLAISNPAINGVSGQESIQALEKRRDQLIDQITNLTLQLTQLPDIQ